MHSFIWCTYLGISGRQLHTTSCYEFTVNANNFPSTNFSGIQTVSTDTFQALTVISPNTLQLRYEHAKLSIFKLKNNTLVNAFFLNKDIQHNARCCQLHPVEMSSHSYVSIMRNSYTICQKFHALHWWLWHQDRRNFLCNGKHGEGISVGLDDKNSVYQSEMYAIINTL